MTAKELIEWLRERGSDIGLGHHPDAKLFYQAADCIEALLAENEKLRGLVGTMLQSQVKLERAQELDPK